MIGHYLSLLVIIDHYWSLLVLIDDYWSLLIIDWACQVRVVLSPHGSHGFRCFSLTALDLLWEPRCWGRSMRVTCSRGSSLVGCIALRSSPTAGNWPITSLHPDAPVSDVQTRWRSNRPQLVMLPLSSRSSGAAHPPVRQTRPDQSHDGAVVVWPRLRRLRRLRPAVDSSGPPVRHSDPPDRPRAGRHVPRAALQLHRGDHRRGRSQGGSYRPEPANPEERQDKWVEKLVSSPCLLSSLIVSLLLSLCPLLLFPLLSWGTLHNKRLLTNFLKISFFMVLACSSSFYPPGGDKYSMFLLVYPFLIYLYIYIHYRSKVWDHLEKHCFFQWR